VLVRLAPYSYPDDVRGSDPIFRATQEMAYNTKLIDAANVTIQSSEDELARLSAISLGSDGWWSGAKAATKERARYVLEKMRTAQSSLEKLEQANAELKKVLKRGA
jgi:hypothetical protein